MLSGTFLAQVIPIVAAPVLTRLYPPREFAILGLYAALVAPLAVLSTMRYEFAILLPRRDRAAWGLAQLSLGLCVVSAGLLLGPALLSSKLLADAMGDPELSRWIPLVPLSVLLLGVFQALSYWLNRQRTYGLLAASTVARQLIAITVQVGAGVAGYLRHGLVAGYIAGQLASIAVLGREAVRAGMGRGVSRRALRALAKRYEQFPRYNLPLSLITTLASGLVLVALTTQGYLAIAGYVALARQVLIMPIGLISSSLGQVYFREAASSFRTPRFAVLSERLFNLSVRSGAPIAILGAFWAPELFALVFGPDWTASGVYAAALAPFAFGALLTSWPERIFEVGGRQRLKMVIQVATDVATIVALWAMLALGVSPLNSLLAYSVLYLGASAVYLRALFHVAGFSTSMFRSLLSRAAAAGTSALVILAVRRLLSLPTQSGLLLDILLIAGLVSFLNRSSGALGASEGR